MNLVCPARCVIFYSDFYRGCCSPPPMWLPWFPKLFFNSCWYCSQQIPEFWSSQWYSDKVTNTVLLIFTSFIQMSHLQCSWLFCRLIYFLHLWIVTEIKYATLAYISLDVTLFSSFTICLYCCFLIRYIFILAAYFMSPLHIKKYISVWYIDISNIDILDFTNSLLKIKKTLMSFSLNI